MRKIPTMFVRDEAAKGHPVTAQVKPECQWVLDGEGIATIKVDGTNVKIKAGQLLKRQKPAERDYDDAAYVPCDRSNPADKWAYEAFDALAHRDDAIYELIGPKVQGNPQKVRSHQLIRVVPPLPTLIIAALGADYKDQIVRTFDGLRAYFQSHEVEGLVFHHPDGRLAKIKRRDFGLAWG